MKNWKISWLSLAFAATGPYPYLQWVGGNDGARYNLHAGIDKISGGCMNWKYWHKHKEKRGGIPFAHIPWLLMVIAAWRWGWQQQIWSGGWDGVTSFGWWLDPMVVGLVWTGWVVNGVCVCTRHVLRALAWNHRNRKGCYDRCWVWNGTVM